MTKWTLVLGLALATAACSSTPADNAAATDAAGGAAPAAAAAPAAPRFREVTLPTGTPLSLELKSSVGSATSKVEDAVRADVREAVTVDGATVIPAGTELAGVVTGADRSGRVKGRARVAYRFNNMRLGNDSIDIQTASITHQAEATKGEDATKIGIGAGAGAALGAILGGGDGAAKGAAIGGAAGTGAVLATRGKEVSAGPGAHVSTKLMAPLTLRVRVS